MPQHVLRAATGLFILSLLAACSRPEPPAEPVRAVRTLVVGAQGAAPGAQYAAEIRARTETALSFRVAGRLDARAVDNGQRVAAGQLLARLDPTDYRLGQQAAEAGLSAARTSLEQAEADLQRSRDLRAQGFVGPAELERRENAAKAARAQWEQARASSEGQGRQTEYTRLTAPAAGVVTAVLAEPGQVLSAGTPVLRLAHDGPLDAVFQVPEDQVSKVRALVGKAGALSVVAWGDSREWPARVREVAGAADPVTRTFAVRADLGSATLALGQTAVARWTSAEGAAALRLPLSAVVAQGAGSAVWLLDRATGSVRLQAVQVGTAQGNELLITGGLKAGDEVVTAGTHVLTPGQKVKPWQAPAASAAAK
jgi:RND family efflux transporter MFP subunit